MDARRTPPHPVPGVPRPTPDPTLERGFVASLRWLVAEGDARGVRRIAVELRALREALETLDETRRARDEHAERAAELDGEIRQALQMLGEATKVEGNGSLVARLARLRDILGRDLATRRALVIERDSWRAMCELQTRTRAMVHTLLEESERAREELEAQAGTLQERMAVLTTVHQDTVDQAAEQRRAASMAVTELARLQETAAILRERVASIERERDELQPLRLRLPALERTLERESMELQQLRDRFPVLEREREQDRAQLQRLRDRLPQLERERDIAAADARDTAAELAALRTRLAQWSGTVERAIGELARAAGALNMDARQTGPPANS